MNHSSNVFEYIFCVCICAQACSASLKRTLNLSANKHYPLSAVCSCPSQHSNARRSNNVLQCLRPDNVNVITPRACLRSGSLHSRCASFHVAYILQNPTLPEWEFPQFMQFTLFLICHPRIQTCMIWDCSEYACSGSKFTIHQ